MQWERIFFKLLQYCLFNRHFLGVIAIWNWPFFLHIFCRRLGLGVLVLHLKLRSREEGGGRYWPQILIFWPQFYRFSNFLKLHRTASQCWFVIFTKDNQIFFGYKNHEWISSTTSACWYKKILLTLRSQTL